MVNTEVYEMLKRHPRLSGYLERLRGITGFVSILGTDPRIQVFNRYHHIMRVARLTSWLCDLFPAIDREASLLVALSHDLNRLPFAHNLEKHIGFDQAENLETYLANHECSLSASVISSAKDTLIRNPLGNAVSRLVHAADSAAGFIEDPLFLLTAFGFRNTFIPKTVTDDLLLDFTDSYFSGEVSELTGLFHEDVSQYVLRFNELVFRLATRFLNRYNHSNLLFVDTPQFPTLRRKLKNNFLSTHVHPWNNEKISHGTRLANEIGIPFINSLRAEGRDAIAELFDMTDMDLLVASFERGLIDSQECYYPRLPD